VCNVPIYYFLHFEGEKKSRGRPAGLSATAAAVPVREKDGCRGGSPVRAFLNTGAAADWRAGGRGAEVRTRRRRRWLLWLRGEVGYRRRGGEESKDAGRPPPHGIPTPRPTRSHPTTGARARGTTGKKAAGGAREPGKQTRTATPSQTGSR